MLDPSNTLLSKITKLVPCLLFKNALPWCVWPKTNKIWIFYHIKHISKLILFDLFPIFRSHGYISLFKSSRFLNNQEWRFIELFLLQWFILSFWKQFGHLTIRYNSPLSLRIWIPFSRTLLFSFQKMSM